MDWGVEYFFGYDRTRGNTIKSFFVDRIKPPSRLAVRSCHATRLNSSPDGPLGSRSPKSVRPMASCPQERMSRSEPVGRLYDLLAEAIHTPRTKRSGRVWAEVLRIPDDDPAEVLFAVGEIIKLVREAKDAVASLEGVDTQLYL